MVIDDIFSLLNFRYTVDYFMLQNVCSKSNTLSNSGPKNKWKTLQNFFLKISQPCNQMIVSCNYASIQLDCSRIFRKVLTDEGICCSFNLLAPELMFRE